LTRFYATYLLLRGGLLFGPSCASQFLSAAKFVLIDIDRDKHATHSVYTPLSSTAWYATAQISKDSCFAVNTADTDFPDFRGQKYATKTPLNNNLNQRTSRERKSVW